MESQKTHRRCFSFEFFPPNTPEGAEKLAQTAKQLAQLRPEFFSVTYGAGGTTLGEINGQRMILNAVFVPATRPVGCNLDFLSYLRTVSGQVVEDVNGDGNLSDAVPEPNVNVRRFAAGTRRVRAHCTRSACRTSVTVRARHQQWKAWRHPGDTADR